MKDSCPSDQEWKQLYTAAITFKEIKCWDWMDDTELFGVQNPADGEIGYCCVLGALGEVFGLNVYLGTDGLQGYFRLQSAEDIEIDQIEALYLQKSLALTFENKALLQKMDRQVVNRLGLNFKGRKAWPFFRSYQPGFQPWYLTKEEALFFTLALEQAKKVALDFREDWHLLNPPSKEHCLVRVAAGEGESLEWKNQWVKFPQLGKAGFVVPAVDEIRLKRIEDAEFPKANIWECDFFYVPAAIQGEDRPYFPIAFLWVDQKTGFVLKHELFEHADYQPNLQKAFMKTVEDTKFLPQEVRVRKEETYKLLEPITRKLGIRLILTKSTPALQEAQGALLGFLMPEK